LAPWQNPVPLTRAWFLWELYCTILTKEKFEIALSKKEERKFFHDLASDVDGCVQLMFSSVNVEKSQALKQEDRVRIFEAVESTVGFQQLNSIVFHHLREWIVSVTEFEILHSNCVMSQTPMWLNCWA
jgi:hypothetical protein